MSLSALELAKKTIGIEVEALQAMSNRLDENFLQAIEIILTTRGRVVVIGMGKSGLIGQKIVATLASTGTPSFFVHPGEAFHGDLGMIKPIDVALLISNSGETEEVIRLLPFLQYQQNKIIAMVSRRNSALGRHADVVMDISVEREACNNNLAPTSSTTATLVMGDALAVALSVERGFQPEDFARFHPGGNLGRKLLTRVADVMHKENLPTCAPEDTFRDVVHIINHGRLGLALVFEDRKLQGLITDGDVRRAFDFYHEYRTLTASQIMSREPKSVDLNMRLADAETLMQSSKINALIAKDVEGNVAGVLQIYDLNRV